MIRDIDSFVESLWSWSVLDGCFGNSRIGVTDIDGCVERRGNVLFIESKRTGVSVPTGQRILFESLQSAGHSVLVVHGDAGANRLPAVTGVQIYNPGADGPEDVQAANTDDFRRLVARWYSWANSE